MTKKHQFLAATEDTDLGLIELTKAEISPKLDQLVAEFGQTVTLRHPVTDTLQYRRRFKPTKA